ncbi:hypothetical protein DPMN_105183 [Dreissena polymorpha]|uniref:Uncharacterized protein n=1 Tax=Dreissena polymorpha TaxID=45954 RepID=A0A9D4HEB9_DREPO|nr:hypothetical protein DPMN_105183 [Dreissena polymorpha]
MMPTCATRIRRPLRVRPLPCVTRGGPNRGRILPPRVGDPAPRDRLPLFTSIAFSLPNVGVRPPVKVINQYTADTS